ncbi:MAG: hypothetical protein LBM20_01310 [Rikenellaceae bacterium]|jgi:hypothetical protein|nr:hypothetical protein [Rikenellaceae bacterium]
MRPFDDYANIINEVIGSSIRRNTTLLSNAATFSSLAGQDDIFVDLGRTDDHIAWTHYREGKICFQEIRNGDDAMSFEFTGCAMAKFTYTDSNNRSSNYVCHIYLQGQGQPNDTRESWNTFVNSGSISNIVLFYPFNYFNVRKDVIKRDTDVMNMNKGKFIINYFAAGVIDNDNVCKAFFYSVKMNMDERKATIEPKADHKLTDGEIYRGEIGDTKSIIGANSVDSEAQSCCRI